MKVGDYIKVYVDLGDVHNLEVVRIVADDEIIGKEIDPDSGMLFLASCLKHRNKNLDYDGVVEDI